MQQLLPLLKPLSVTLLVCATAFLIAQSFAPERPSADHLAKEQAYLSYLLEEDGLAGLEGSALNLEQRDRICLAIAHGLIQAPRVYYGFSDDGTTFDKLYTGSGEDRLAYFENTGCSTRIPTLPSGHGLSLAPNS